MSDVQPLLQELGTLCEGTGVSGVEIGSRQTELQALRKRIDDGVGPLNVQQNAFYNILRSELSTITDNMTNVLTRGAWSNRFDEAMQAQLRRGAETRRIVFTLAGEKVRLMENILTLPDSARPELRAMAEARKDQLRQIVVDLDRRMTIEEYRQMSLYHFLSSVNEYCRELNEIPAGERANFLRDNVLGWRETHDRMLVQLNDLKSTLEVSNALTQMRVTLQNFTGTPEAHTTAIAVSKRVLETRLQDRELRMPLARTQSRQIFVTRGTKVQIGGLELNDANRARIETETGLRVTREDDIVTINAINRIETRPTIAVQIGEGETLRTYNLPVVLLPAQARPDSLNTTRIHEFMTLVGTGSVPANATTRRAYLAERSTKWQNARMDLESSIMPSYIQPPVGLTVNPDVDSPIRLTLNPTNEPYLMTSAEALLLAAQTGRHRYLANEIRRLLGESHTEVVRGDIRTKNAERMRVIRRFLESNRNAMRRKITIQNLFSQCEHLGTPMEIMDEGRLQQLQRTRRYLQGNLAEREAIRRIGIQMQQEMDANNGELTDAKRQLLTAALLRVHTAMTTQGTGPGFTWPQTDWDNQAGINTIDPMRILSSLGIVSHAQPGARMFTAGEVATLQTTRTYLNGLGRPIANQIIAKLGQMRVVDETNEGDLTRLRAELVTLINSVPGGIRLAADAGSTEIQGALELLDVLDAPMAHMRLGSNYAAELTNGRRQNLRHLRDYLTEWRQQMDTGQLGPMAILQHVSTMRIMGRRGILTTRIDEQFQELQDARDNPRIGVPGFELSLRGLYNFHDSRMPLGMAGIRAETVRNWLAHYWEIPDGYDLIETALMAPPNIAAQGEEAIAKWRQERITALRAMPDNNARRTWLQDHFSDQNFTNSVKAIHDHFRPELFGKIAGLEGVLDTQEELLTAPGTWKPEDLATVRESERPGWWPALPAAPTPDNMRTWRETIVTNMAKVAPDHAQFAQKQKHARWVYEELPKVIQQRDDELATIQESYLNALSQNFTSHITGSIGERGVGNFRLIDLMITAGIAAEGAITYRVIVGLASRIANYRTGGRMAGLARLYPTWLPGRSVLTGSWSPLRPLNALFEHVPGLRPQILSDMTRRVLELQRDITVLRAGLPGTATQLAARELELARILRELGITRDAMMQTATRELARIEAQLARLRANPSANAARISSLNAQRTALGQEIARILDGADNATRLRYANQVLETMFGRWPVLRTLQQMHPERYAALQQGILSAHNIGAGKSLSDTIEYGGRTMSVRNAKWLELRRVFQEAGINIERGSNGYRAMRAMMDGFCGQARVASTVAHVAEGAEVFRSFNTAREIALINRLLAAEKLTVQQAASLRYLVQSGRATAEQLRLLRQIEAAATPADAAAKTSQLARTIVGPVGRFLHAAGHVAAWGGAVLDAGLIVHHTRELIERRERIEKGMNELGERLRSNGFILVAGSRTCYRHASSNVEVNIANMEDQLKANANWEEGLSIGSSAIGLAGFGYYLIAGAPAGPVGWAIVIGAIVIQITVGLIVSAMSQANRISYLKDAPEFLFYMWDCSSALSMSTHGLLKDLYDPALLRDNWIWSCRESATQRSAIRKKLAYGLLATEFQRYAPEVLGLLLARRDDQGRPAPADITAFFNDEQGFGRVYKNWLEELQSLTGRTLLENDGSERDNDTECYHALKDELKNRRAMRYAVARHLVDRHQERRVVIEEQRGKLEKEHSEQRAMVPRNNLRLAEIEENLTNLMQERSVIDMHSVNVNTLNGGWRDSNTTRTRLYMAAFKDPVTVHKLAQEYTEVPENEADRVGTNLHNAIHTMQCINYNLPQENFDLARAYLMGGGTMRNRINALIPGTISPEAARSMLTDQAGIMAGTFSSDYRHIQANEFFPTPPWPADKQRPIVLFGGPNGPGPHHGEMVQMARSISGQYPGLLDRSEVQAVSFQVRRIRAQRVHNPGWEYNELGMGRRVRREYWEDQYVINMTAFVRYQNQTIVLQRGSYLYKNPRIVNDQPLNNDWLVQRGTTRLQHHEEFIGPANQPNRENRRLEGVVSHHLSRRLSEDLVAESNRRFAPAATERPARFEPKPQVAELYDHHPRRPGVLVSAPTSMTFAPDSPELDLCKTLLLPPNERDGEDVQVTLFEIWRVGNEFRAVVSYYDGTNTIRRRGGRLTVRSSPVFRNGVQVNVPEGVNHTGLTLEAVPLTAVPALSAFGLSRMAPAEAATHTHPLAPDTYVNHLNNASKRRNKERIDAALALAGGDIPLNRFVPVTVNQFILHTTGDGGDIYVLRTLSGTRTDPDPREMTITTSSGERVTARVVVPNGQHPDNILIHRTSDEHPDHEFSFAHLSQLGATNPHYTFIQREMALDAITRIAVPPEVDPSTINEATIDTSMELFLRSFAFEKHTDGRDAKRLLKERIITLCRPGGDVAPPDLHTVMQVLGQRIMVEGGVILLSKLDMLCANLATSEPTPGGRERAERSPSRLVRTRHDEFAIYWGTLNGPGRTLATLQLGQRYQERLGSGRVLPHRTDRWIGTERRVRRYGPTEYVVRNHSSGFTTRWSMHTYFRDRNAEGTVDQRRKHELFSRLLTAPMSVTNINSNDFGTPIVHILDGWAYDERNFDSWSETGRDNDSRAPLVTILKRMYTEVPADQRSNFLQQLFAVLEGAANAEGILAHDWQTPNPVDISREYTIAGADNRLSTTFQSIIMEMRRRFPVPQEQVDVEAVTRGRPTVGELAAQPFAPQASLSRSSFGNPRNFIFVQPRLLRTRPGTTPGSYSIITDKENVLRMVPMSVETLWNWDRTNPSITREGVSVRDGVAGPSSFYISRYHNADGRITQYFPVTHIRWLNAANRTGGLLVPPGTGEQRLDVFRTNRYSRVDVARIPAEGALTRFELSPRRITPASGMITLEALQKALRDAGVPEAGMATGGGKVSLTGDALTEENLQKAVSALETFPSAGIHEGVRTAAWDHLTTPLEKNVGRLLNLQPLRDILDLCSREVNLEGGVDQKFALFRGLADMYWRCPHQREFLQSLIRVLSGMDQLLDGTSVAEGTIRAANVPKIIEYMQRASTTLGVGDGWLLTLAGAQMRRPYRENNERQPREVWVNTLEASDIRDGAIVKITRNGVSVFFKFEEGKWKWSQNDDRGFVNVTGNYYARENEAGREHLKALNDIARDLGRLQQNDAPTLERMRKALPPPPPLFRDAPALATPGTFPHLQNQLTLLRTAVAAASPDMERIRTAIELLNENIDGIEYPEGQNLQRAFGAPMNLRDNSGRVTLINGRLMLRMHAEVRTQTQDVYDSIANAAADTPVDVLQQRLSTFNFLLREVGEVGGMDTFLQDLTEVDINLPHHLLRMRYDNGERPEVDRIMNDVRTILREGRWQDIDMRLMEEGNLVAPVRALTPENRRLLALRMTATLPESSTVLFAVDGTAIRARNMTDQERDAPRPAVPTSRPQMILVARPAPTANEMFPRVQAPLSEGRWQDVDIQCRDASSTFARNVSTMEVAQRAVLVTRMNAALPATSTVRFVIEDGAIRARNMSTTQIADQQHPERNTEVARKARRDSFVSAATADAATPNFATTLGTALAALQWDLDRVEESARFGWVTALNTQLIESGSPVRVRLNGATLERAIDVNPLGTLRPQVNALIAAARVGPPTVPAATQTSNLTAALAMFSTHLATAEAGDRPQLITALNAALCRAGTRVQVRINGNALERAPDATTGVAETPATAINLPPAGVLYDQSAEREWENRGLIRLFIQRQRSLSGGDVARLEDRAPGYETQFIRYDNPQGTIGAGSDQLRAWGIEVETVDIGRAMESYQDPPGTYRFREAPENVRMYAYRIRFTRPGTFRVSGQTMINGRASGTGRILQSVTVTSEQVTACETQRNRHAQSQIAARDHWNVIAGGQEGWQYYYKSSTGRLYATRNGHYTSLNTSTWTWSANSTTRPEGIPAPE